MSKHDHHCCEHEVKYCKVCDVAYCVKCGKEWKEQSIWHYAPYGITPNVTYTTGMSSGTSSGHAH
jgi:hypothetical protein